MNPKALQYIMGHSDISVTLNTYTHIGFEDAAKEMQGMSSNVLDIANQPDRKQVS